MASSFLSLFLQGEIFITQAKQKQTSLCEDCQGAADTRRYYYLTHKPGFLLHLVSYITSLGFPLWV